MCLSRHRLLAQRFDFQHIIVKFATSPLIPHEVHSLTACRGNPLPLRTYNRLAYENGFTIERKTGTSGTYAQVAMMGANISSYTNPNPRVRS